MSLAADLIVAAQTLIAGLIEAGVRVRILPWYPFSRLGGMKPHMHSHIYLLYLVRALNAKVKRDHPGLNEDLGAVLLDLRQFGRDGLDFPYGSHHQKFMVIRSLERAVAFCGGIDLTYTRIDYPLGSGDPQSGEDIPPRNRFIATALQENNAQVQVPDVLVAEGSDLPPEIYGANYQRWHDQHLKLEGPIVATLEAIFAYRWEQTPYEPRVLATPPLTNDQAFWITTENGNVISNSAEVFTANELTPIALLANAVRPIGAIPPLTDPNTGQTLTAIVQAWQTLPARKPFRGEFSVMAGLRKACAAAQKLILIFDQYFWSLPFARYLREQVVAKNDLRILIVLPPFADLQPFDGADCAVQHTLRRHALEALHQGLTPQQSGRIGVYALWNNIPALSNRGDLGIYCHAKVQVFDQSLVVCGSANINLRSHTTDSELCCAVLDREFARTYFRTIWTFLFPEPFAINLDDEAGWALALWNRFRADEFRAQVIKDAGDRNLIEDPWQAAATSLPTKPGATARDNDNEGFYMNRIRGIFDPLSLRPEVLSPTGRHIVTGQLIAPTLADVVLRIETLPATAYRVDIDFER